LSKIISIKASQVVHYYQVFEITDDELERLKKDFDDGNEEKIKSFVGELIQVNEVYDCGGIDQLVISELKPKEVDNPSDKKPIYESVEEIGVL
jgi:hypothetical protein